MFANLKLKIMLGYTAFVVVLIAIGIWFQFWAQHQVDTINDLCYHDQVSIVAQDMLLNLQQAESSRRGYVITKDTTYIRSYYTSVTRVERSMNAIKDLNVVGVYQDAFLDSLRNTVEQKIATLKVSVEALLQKRSSDSLQVSLTKAGHELMEPIRSTVEEMSRDNERESKSQRNSIVNSLITVPGQLLATMVVLILIAAATGFVTLLSVRTLERQTEKTESDLQLTSTQLMNLLSKRGDPGGS